MVKQGYEESIRVLSGEKLMLQTCIVNIWDTLRGKAKDLKSIRSIEVNDIVYQSIQNTEKLVEQVSRATQYKRSEK